MEFSLTPSYYKNKTSYPGAGYFLYHSDNSMVPSYMENAEPAPRGHRGFEEGPFRPIGVGGTIYYPLKKSAIKKGLKIFPQTEARSLVITRRKSCWDESTDAAIRKISSKTQIINFSRRDAIRCFFRPLILAQIYCK